MALAAPQVSRQLESTAFSHARAIRWRMSSFQIRSSARPSKTLCIREQRLKRKNETKNLVPANSGWYGRWIFVPPYSSVWNLIKMKKGLDVYFCLRKNAHIQFFVTALNVSFEPLTPQGMKKTAKPPRLSKILIRRATTRSIPPPLATFLSPCHRLR